MKLLFPVVAVLAALVFAAGGRADADSPTHYYLSLGDSLAASFQPNLDVSHGYAEQLHAALAAADPKLELVKLGCGGESSVSLISGLPDGCQPRFLYPNTIYPHGTQLAEAVNFLRAHKDKVSLVTIDIGGNDFLACGGDPGCFGASLPLLRTHLAGILAALQGSARGVPIVGMSYYDALAPVCVSTPLLGYLCSELDALNAVLADTYTAAGVPVADVAGAFENDDLAVAAAHVCAWTWFCSDGDVHANTAGYGVIAQALRQVVP